MQLAVASIPLLGAPGLEILTEDMATLALVGAGSVALFILLLLLLVKNFLHIARPNEALIFTGRRRMRNGVDLGPMIVLGRGDTRQADEHHGGGRGRAWRVPIIERVDRLDMSVMSIDVAVNNAYSAGNIPLRIHAIANVKISSDPRLIRNAIERFLGQSQQEIMMVARQTLEGLSLIHI